MKKSLLILSLVFSVVFAGCNLNTGSSGASEYTISGKVIDPTGSGVAGAKVGFGSNITTSDANGNYSVTVKANKAITGNFYVCKGTDYNFQVLGGINFTPISDLGYNIIIEPVASNFPIHNVHGFIYEADGSNEIAEGANVEISIYNKNGGIPYNTGISSYSSTAEYSIDTPIFGSNCLIAITVYNDTNPAYNYYIDNIDLSASDVSLNLTKPSSGFTQVTVTGVDGDEFWGFMKYSNFQYPLAFREVLSGSGTTSVNFDIYNPEHKAFLWATRISLTDSPDNGDFTDKIKVSAASVPGATVTLPVPSLAAPTHSVSGSSIIYSPGTGTLSFTDTGNADMFYIVMNPDEQGMSGIVVSPTTSIELPADIMDIITSQSDSYHSWDADITSINTSASFNIDHFFDIIRYEALSPDIEFAEVENSNAASTNLIP